MSNEYGINKSTILSKLKTETINLIHESNRLTNKVIELDKQIKECIMLGVKASDLVSMKEKLINKLNSTLSFKRINSNYLKIAELEKSLNKVTVEIKSPEMARVLYSDIKSFSSSLG